MDVHQKPLLERIVDPLATGLGNGIGWLAERGVLFVVFLLIWVALGAALILNPGTVDELWVSLGGLPLVVQLVIWLLFLPVMAALWVWQTDWPELIRILIVLGLAGWTLLVFRPKWLRLPGRGAGLKTKAG